MGLSGDRTTYKCIRDVINNADRSRPPPASGVLKLSMADEFRPERSDQPRVALDTASHSRVSGRAPLSQDTPPSYVLYNDARCVLSLLIFSLHFLCMCLSL